VTQPRHGEPLPLGGAQGLPYSKGVLARALTASGVPADHAYELARRVEEELTATRDASLTPERLDELAVETFGDVEGREIVRRVRRFRELRELELPIVVLIGGSTGTGKSTVATEVAYRLGITRVTSTDFIRQTMRAFFSSDFMPSIHYSSFEAHQALREPDEAQDPLVAGFLEQTRNVAVGMRASIERCLEEGWSMVLEGVHVVPGLLHEPASRALFVQCVLQIADEEAHAAHFFHRDLTSDERRPVLKYLDHLDAIRHIQEYVVARAKRLGVPVIDTPNMDAAVGEVMELVLEAAERLQARV
jgi:2-phosphoglycerate kinase